jgi:hypothetical protein
VITPARVAEILAGLLPVKAPLVILELAFHEGAQAEEDEHGNICAYFQLIVCDLDESGARCIRAIKEQLVCFVPQKRRDDPEARLAAYAAGWSDALKEVFTSKEAANVAETLMPQDLVDPDVLDLARPDTREAFRDALLTKSRLGALLRGVPDPDPKDESVF